MKKLLVISDLHCGHAVGLTPPEWQHGTPDDAPRHLKKTATQRQILWEWFAAEMKKLGKPDILIVNGDAIDGPGSKSGGVEQICVSRDEQVQMAVDVIQFIGGKRLMMTYGTPYHTGEKENWEDIIARDCAAERIENEGDYEVEGLVITAKHIIGNSSSPISAATAMQSAHIKRLLWEGRGLKPRANLVIRSHIHRCYGLIHPGINWQGWTTPALQGLGSRYGARQVDGLPVEFGFLEIRVTDAQHWSVTAHVSPLALQASEITKL